MRLFAGLDWGSSGHAVCVVDEQGKIVAQFEVAHDAAGLTELRARLAKLAPAAEIPIAIERPTGLIVDALVDAGHVVVPIHPNVVKACRPRYRAAGGKDDRGDSYLLADVLCTDAQRVAGNVVVGLHLSARRHGERGESEDESCRVANCGSAHDRPSHPLVSRSRLRVCRRPGALRDSPSRRTRRRTRPARERHRRGQRVVPRLSPPTSNRRGCLSQ
jgi:hypothetical protein